MTKYEELMEKADKALKRAIVEHDLDLRVFYLNASKGFKNKALKLSLEQAMEVKNEFSR